jgi:hypothetical protein
MTDAQVVHFLKEQGYPEHVWRAGRQGLIDGWRRFVEEVERGYGLGLEDYRNDLDLRAIIARAGLEAEVRELDARFEAQLTTRDTVVWEAEPADAFWVRGYPRNAAGDLRDDLAAEGLLRP